MRTPRSDFEDLFRSMWGNDQIQGMRSGSYEVPTDVFHIDGALVIRMDLPNVDPDGIEVTVQENVLLVNGSRRFPYDPDKVRFVRRGTFYGDFTQRISLGKGLDVDKIEATHHAGVLELKIPYAEEVQPRKISVNAKALSSN
jgi:HSP20 family protein